MNDPARYFVLVDSQEKGPFSIVDISTKLRSSELTVDTLYSTSGMTEWKPLKTLPWVATTDWSQAATPFISNEDIHAWGSLLLVIGLTGMVFFGIFFGSSIMVGDGEVFNLSKALDRLLGFFGSISLLGFGAFLIVCDKLNQVIRLGNTMQKEGSHGQ